jgi:hypothetical protein
MMPMVKPEIARLSVLAMVAFAAIMSMPGAATANKALASNTLMQYICNGTSTTNGIIAKTPIIGTGTQGVTSVVGLTVLIMLTMIFIMAAFYMLSQVLRLPSLTNFVKVELAEMAGTVFIIAIFFGAFYAASFAATGGGAQNQGAPQNPTLHFNGPGRSVFVDDCMMVGGSSLSLLSPIMTAGVVDWALNFFDSATFKITPGGFGFTVSPLSGLSMIPNTLDQLSGILSGFLVALLAVNFLLGLVYALFPIFLYLGIVLRAFPWTRAAGGIFIAIFIGFYVVFPLMIYATVGGFSQASYQVTASYYTSNAFNGIASFTSNSISANSIGGVSQQLSGFSSITSVLSYIFGNGGVLYSMSGLPGGMGLINGYIADFMGPPIMVIIEVALSFIVALDFADILSDILGAPSLQTERLLGKLL